MISIGRDRTQEVAGSSPASSTPRIPANAKIRVFDRQAEIVLSSDTTASVPVGVAATIEDQGSGRYAITEVSGGLVSLTIEGQTKLVSQPTALAAWTFVGFAQPVDNGGTLKRPARDRGSSPDHHHCVTQSAPRSS